MKAFAAAVTLAAALVLVPTAGAKFRMTMTLGDSTPRAGHAFTVVVRTERSLPENDWLRLIAVAPGASLYDVIGVVTGDSSLAQANIPHDGFEIKLVRTAPNRWRAFARLPRAGRWRLVVPNGTHAGFMYPPPIVRAVSVG